MENVINISSPQDFDKIKIKYNQYIKYICSNCGEENIIQYRPSYKQRLMKMLCTKCSSIETNLIKYGVENPSQNKDIRNKIKETNLNKYGCESPLSNVEIREKGEQTRLEKYGDPNYTNREKSKQTMLEKHGVEYPMQYDEGKLNFTTSMQNKYGINYSGESKELFDKTKNTKFLKYGNEFYTNFKQIRETKSERYGNPNYYNLEKAKQTMLEKYGYDSYMKTKDFKIKSNETLMNKYGTTCSNFSYKYRYFGLNFDSSWELYFYIYCILMGVPVIRNETEYLEYIVDNKVKRYYPDFKIIDSYGQRYVEIKGNQFLDDNGKLSILFKHDRNGDELDLENKQKICDSKQKCMEDNNVLVISAHDISYIKNIVNFAFYSNYINSFKLVGNEFVYRDFVMNKCFKSEISTTYYNPYNIDTKTDYTGKVYLNNNCYGITPYDII